MMQLSMEHAACMQVLCCEVDGIFDALVHSDNLLEELFSFLDQEPLNKSRAAYFLRVIVSLLTKCSASVMAYIAGECSCSFLYCLNHFNHYVVALCWVLMHAPQPGCW